MSLVDILSNKPLRLSLITGVVSSSYYFCANIGSSCFGIIPAIQDQNSKNDLSTATKVKLWKWFYDRAKFHFAGSTALSAVSFSTAAYFCNSPSLRKLLLCAVGLSSLVIPFTVAVMMPINRELGALLDSGSLSDSSKTDPDEGEALQQRALERIERWKQMHKVRLLLGAGAWVAGLVAFTFDM